MSSSPASGIDSYEHRVIGDNQTRIVAALRDLLERADAVLICGGLGPTQDDLTRDAIAELMGVPLVRAHGARRARSPRCSAPGCATCRRTTCARPTCPRAATRSRTRSVPRPGLLCELADGKVVYAVPGVPYEMQQMVTEHVHPRPAAPFG